MCILFLIVGNSGSGKDSLIKEVMKIYPKNLKELKIPRRVITRPSSPETEDFESVDVDTFMKLKNSGAFAFDWYIYNIYYGVRKEIFEWLQNGNPVLVNVSRMIIDEVKNCYPNVRVIFVKVPFEIIRKRIIERGRENDKLIKERLERAKRNLDLPDADCIIDNSEPLEKSSKKLLKYILKEMQQFH